MWQKLIDAKVMQMILKNQICLLDYLAVNYSGAYQACTSSGY
jgi:hypothetical protein